MSRFKGWRTVGVVIGGLVAVELLSRVVLPGINPDAVRQYLANGGGGGLLTLYDRIGGGALTRGAILAVGLMPYLAAKLWVRLAQITAPKVKALTDTAAGQRQLKRITRWLTAGFSFVQAFGYAQFLEKIPGAVSHPGVGFLTTTVVTLTGASLAAMLIAEYVGARLQDHEPEYTFEPESSATPQLTAGPASMPMPDARVGETIRNEDQ